MAAVCELPKTPPVGMPRMRKFRVECSLVTWAMDETEALQDAGAAVSRYDPRTGKIPYPWQGDLRGTVSVREVE